MATDEKIKKMVIEALTVLVNDEDKMKVLSYATQLTPTVFKMLKEQRERLLEEIRCSKVDNYGECGCMIKIEKVFALEVKE